MREASDLSDHSFVKAEYRRLMMSDESLKVLCERSVQVLLPHRHDAAPLIAEILKNRIIEKVPTSLVRVGDGEGNVCGLACGPAHPIQLESFNGKFFAQNGTRLPQDEARMLCGRIREALCTADLIGFRSFDAPRPEPEIILGNLADGQLAAALGILYARALLQDELTRGHFSDKLITSAWIHLALIPYISDIMDAAPAIIVITGRAILRQHFEVRLGQRLRRFIAVPPQGYFPASDDDSHYRKAFPRVLDALSGDLRGTLVLVGAGFLGKLYCQAAKNSGAVAVDFGSAFDILAGVVTRPIHATVNVDALRWV